MIRVFTTTAALSLLLSSSAVLSAGEVVTYLAPQGGDLSTDYEVTVDGKKIDLYITRNSPFFNPVCIDIMKQVRKAVKGY